MLQEQPRVFVAGNEPRYLERAARRGYTPIVTVGAQPVKVLEQVKAHVAQHFAKAGWADGLFPFGIQRSVFVTDDKKQALYAAEQSLYTARLVMAFRGGYEKVNGFEIVPQPFENEPTPEQIASVLPMGDPETCAERITAEIQAVRPSHYSFFMQYGAMDGKTARRSLERLIGEVLPLVDKAVGGLKQFGPRPVPSAAR
jgi:alkanesulfonate monooxygenase SsuD/methylene tetrahydromethanopterin reductase-like flavin-dependent oxidoreductase (luciferase family)